MINHAPLASVIASLVRTYRVAASLTGKPGDENEIRSFNERDRCESLICSDL